MLVRFVEVNSVMYSKVNRNRKFSVHHEMFKEEVGAHHFSLLLPMENQA